MKKNIYVAPSTDPITDYQEILEYAKSLQNIADYLHCDVMDENFVSKTNYDYSFVNAINANTILPLDVHLMVNEPFEVLKDYLAAGANILTVHYEAFQDKLKLVEAIKLIKSAGALAGISLKPSTSLEEAKTFLYTVDIVLIMSVEPGASGQSFMPEIFKKVVRLNKFRQDNNLNFKIEVDGGINPEIAKKLTESGVDILVSGNYVFKSQNREQAINSLKE